MYNWSKEIETGNAAIDSQHKQWIDALNRLLDACAHGQGRDAIRSTLVFLQDYTAKHFRDEETLQVRYKYPGYTTHKQYHEGFKKVVQETIAQYDREGPSIALVSKINTNLGGWFINHIKREDVQVANHIKQSNA